MEDKLTALTDAASLLAAAYTLLEKCDPETDYSEIHTVIDALEREADKLDCALQDAANDGGAERSRERAFINAQQI